MLYVKLMEKVNRINRIWECKYPFWLLSHFTFTLLLFSGMGVITLHKAVFISVNNVIALFVVNNTKACGQFCKRLTWRYDFVSMKSLRVISVSIAFSFTKSNRGEMNAQPFAARWKTSVSLLWNVFCLFRKHENY